MLWWTTETVTEKLPPIKAARNPETLGRRGACPASRLVISQRRAHRRGMAGIERSDGRLDRAALRWRKAGGRSMTSHRRCRSRRQVTTTKKTRLHGLTNGGRTSVLSRFLASKFPWRCGAVCGQGVHACLATGAGHARLPGELFRCTRTSNWSRGLHASHSMR